MSRDVQNVANGTVVGNMKYALWLVPLTLTTTFMLNSPDSTWNFFTLCHPNTHYNSSLIGAYPNGLICRYQPCPPFANSLMQIDIYRLQNWKQKKLCNKKKRQTLESCYYYFELRDWDTEKFCWKRKTSFPPTKSTKTTVG